MSDKTRVLTIGQAVVDCIISGKKQADQSASKRADRIMLRTGGDAVNEAFALRKYDVDVQLLCALGDDMAGSVILKEAQKRGVDTSHICPSPDLQTPIAVISGHEDGTRESVSARAAMLEGFHVMMPPLEGVCLVSFASLFRAPFDQAETTIAAVRSAHEAGVLICADTKMPTFRSMSLDDIAEVLPFVDYIFPNETEAAYYSGESDFEKMAEKLLGYGVKHVVIKAGAQGVYAHDGVSFKHYEALPVEVIDTTGAGDNFVAGFIASLLDEQDFESCVHAGLSGAAASISKIGG